jgi:SAM-dependent methyltransferase
MTFEISREKNTDARDKRFARQDIEAVQKGGRIEKEKLDKLLGIIGDSKADEDFIGEEAVQRFPKEKWGYEGTSYEIIRAIIDAIKPQEGQKFYDLGSGQGRVVLYGALATRAHFVGIELIEERVHACNATKERLGIENVEFRAGNVLEEDFSDGDIFYLFNPFNQVVTKQVIDKLRQVAEHKKITLIASGVIQLRFEKEPWLLSVKKVSSPEIIRIFESK